MRNKTHKHRRFRKNACKKIRYSKKYGRKYGRKSRSRARPRRNYRGGSCLDIYPLSSCGGAVGSCDPYYGTANQNGGWRIKGRDWRLSTEKSKRKRRTSHRKRRTSHQKSKTRKLNRMRGGSARDPIIGAELQQGLYSLWNTGERAMNTWNGVKSPFSLDASPLNQPVNLS